MPKSAEMAVQAAKGEAIQTDTTVENGKAKVPAILLEPYAVTKGNINETVIKDGHLSKKILINKTKSAIRYRMADFVKFPLSHRRFS